MSTWGDMPFKPHVESFQEWLDDDIEPVTEDEVPVPEDLQDGE